MTDANTSNEHTDTTAEHNPPSLPTSPLPKRVKPNPAAQMPRDTTDGRPPPPQPGAVPQPGPTPTTTLPPVSAMLPNMPPPPTQAAVLGGPASISAGPFVPAQAAPPIPPLMVQKLQDTATAPTRGSAFAAGYDLYAAAEMIIPSKGKAFVSTGLAIAVPAGTYGRVAPRSGLASKHFIDTGAGVIDADYRGEVKVLLFNFSDVDYAVKQGDRVAQLVLERIVTPEVLVVDKLEQSVRGTGGFGSTGYA